MRNLLLSAAIGDISGMPYEHNRTKDYNAVDLLHPKSDYTDDTVMTFACAEAMLYDDDIAMCMRRRGNADVWRGYGTNFANWLFAKLTEPAYYSYGNGSAMRVSSAGFMATNVEECIRFAEYTALPTHNHPEGIKGAVATALAIFYAMQGKDKDFIRLHVLDEYYPIWSGKTYDDIHPAYTMDESCQGTVPAAIICFLDSKDYADCIKLAISLGGDADTLAAIAGPMAYAYYREMPEELIAHAKSKLPQWMLDLNDEFDDYCIVLNENKRNKNMQDNTTNTNKVSIVCRVRKVVFHNQVNGYSVLSVISDVEDAPFSICGILNGKSEGTVLHCQGEWKEHIMYGRQFIVESWTEGTKKEDNETNTTNNKTTIETTKVVCVVKKLVYYNKENGYMVFSVSTPLDKTTFSINGQLDGIEKNDLLLCEGLWNEHYIYGPQFRVESWKKLSSIVDAPKELYCAEIIDGQTNSYLLSEIVDRIEALISYYHENIFEINKGDDDIRRELYQIAKDCVDENLNASSIDSLMKLYIKYNGIVFNMFWDRVYEMRSWS